MTILCIVYILVHRCCFVDLEFHSIAHFSLQVVALETAGSGVTCNALSPGFVDTPSESNSLTLFVHICPTIHTNIGACCYFKFQLEHVWDGQMILVILSIIKFTLPQFSLFTFDPAFARHGVALKTPRHRGWGV